MCFNIYSHIYLLVYQPFNSINIFFCLKITEKNTVIYIYPTEMFSFEICIKYPYLNFPHQLIILLVFFEKHLKISKKHFQNFDYPLLNLFYVMYLIRSVLRNHLYQYFHLLLLNGVFVDFEFVHLYEFVLMFQLINHQLYHLLQLMFQQIYNYI